MLGWLTLAALLSLFAALSFAQDSKKEKPKPEKKERPAVLEPVKDFFGSMLTTEKEAQ